MLSRIQCSSRSVRHEFIKYQLELSSKGRKEMLLIDHSGCLYFSTLPMLLRILRLDSAGQTMQVGWAEPSSPKGKSEQD